MRFSRWVSKTREAVEKLFSTSNDATSIRQSANSRNKDSKALDYRFHYCGVVISTRLFNSFQGFPYSVGAPRLGNSLNNLAVLYSDLARWGAECPLMAKSGHFSGVDQMSA